jgi:beta-mannosidase
MHDEQLLTWSVEPGPGAVAPPVSGALPARVPGSIHADLIEAGLLEDITVHGRDDEQLWVSQTPWRYRTTLHRPAEPFEHAVLVFEGIDTLGRVTVGGRERLTTRDMFRRHELDVTADLAAGTPVEVVVDLDPVLPLAQEREAANPLPRPAEYWRPFNQVRKMACSFGWDWGPTTLTAGLWRPVHLRSWLGGRFADVRIAAHAADAPAVQVDVLVEGDAAAVEVVVTDGGERVATGTAPVEDGRATVRVPVPGARPWWPHGEGEGEGEGERSLYGVEVRLVGAGQGVLDERRERVGFRTVEIVQTPDGEGSTFEIQVNGRRVWVRGLDWIPDDPFPARITPERYRARLAEAVAAGANTVRVWGGGIYEADAFYDACDELGLLVIQDFLFACAAYPEDDGTVEEVRAEVTDNVRRLRHRASLALWCGNNENLWGYQDWGWQEELAGRPWGLRYYREILPELVAQLDGTRPYVPGSPFSPEAGPAEAGPAEADSTEADSTEAGPAEAPRHPNDPRFGMQHIWDVWNQRDYADYETWRPRFVSEFGYQAPASWPTLTAAVGAPLDPADPGLEHHQRAGGGAAKLQAGLDRHLPEPPAAGVAWYFATQLLQARAVTTGVAHLRSLHDHCSGAIWWQLNDIWPAVSWSVLDVRGRRKLAWHALRGAFDPRLVTIAAGTGAGSDAVRVVLVNDTGQAWRERLVVQVPGRVVLEQEVEVAPHGSVSVDVPVGPAGPQVVVADVGARRATRWLVPDLELTLLEQDALVEVTAPDAGHLAVRVTARALLRDLCLLAELAVPDAVVEGQLATLLPGESAVLVVTLPEGTAPEGVDWTALLWSDNRLRSAAGPATPAVAVRTASAPIG